MENFIKLYPNEFMFIMMFVMSMITTLISIIIVFWWRLFVTKSKISFNDMIICLSCFLFGIAWFMTLPIILIALCMLILIKFAIMIKILKFNSLRDFLQSVFDI